MVTGDCAGSMILVSGIRGSHPRDMKLCRFVASSSPWPSVGLLQDPETLLDLTSVGIESLATLLETDDLAHHLRELGIRNPRRQPLAGTRLLPPIDQQEVWAAGVTY